MINSGRRFSRFILLFAGLLIGLLSAEIGLRVVGFWSPSLYTRDPIRGWSFRPGAEGRWRQEGDAYTRINSQGYRDREHSISKPPNTLRVAVLGDSFTAALQVPMEKTYCSVLEEKLSGCPALGGKKAEVLNFGVSGYGTAQEFLTLRYQVWKYEPDIVILSFYTGNDIRNNHRTLNEDPSLDEGLGIKLNSCPYFVYKDNRLVLDDSFLSSQQMQPDFLRRHNVMADLMNRFRLLQLINKIKYLVISRFQRRQAKPRLVDPRRIERVFGCGENQPCRLEELVDEEGLGLDNLSYFPPQAEAWKEAWRVTEGLVLLMRDEVREHGAQFWIMIDTTGMQVNPDPAVRRSFMKKLGVDTLLYADLRIQMLAEREGIPVIMLAEPLAAYAEAHDVFLHGFKNTGPGSGHWNEAGHEVVGETLAARLCASQ